MQTATEYNFGHFPPDAELQTVLLLLTSELDQLPIVLVSVSGIVTVTAAQKFISISNKFNNSSLTSPNDVLCDEGGVAVSSIKCISQ